MNYSALTAEQKKDLRVRIIHVDSDSAPSLGQLKNWANYEKEKYEQIWNGGFDGYDLSKNHNSGMDVDTGTYEVGFKKGNRRNLT